MINWDDPARDEDLEENQLDPAARAVGFVPISCDLCPPSYGWCNKHNRCERHCACNSPKSEGHNPL